MFWIIMVLAGVARYIPDIFWDTEDTTTRRGRRRVESRDAYACSFESVKPYRKRRKLMPPQPAACPIYEDSLSQVICWLGDDKIGAVGIYGMGGIGKTTLAQQVHARLQYSDNPLTDNPDEFTAVAWVSVGLRSTVAELQQKIAEGFDLDLRGDKDVNRRAALLNALLCSVPKCILFLDDLWQDFRRTDVGIPKHCKLVLTSCSLDVCRMMRCKKVLKVEPLPDKQAWKLFLHALRDFSTLQIQKEIEEVAKLLCRQCGGVPFSINFLANSIRGEVEVSKWTQALENLHETSVRTTLLGDMVCVLRKSYDNLSSTTVQQCFLVCALHQKGKTMSRDEVIHLWIRHGLIDTAQSQQVQYDMGHSILNKLQNSCLLEATEDSKGLKMHDFVRDMGISILKGRDLEFHEVPVFLG